MNTVSASVVVVVVVIDLLRPPHVPYPASTATTTTVQRPFRLTGNDRNRSVDRRMIRQHIIVQRSRYPINQSRPLYVAGAGCSENWNNQKTGTAHPEQDAPATLLQGCCCNAILRVLPCIRHVCLPYLPAGLDAEPDALKFGPWRRWPALETENRSRMLRPPRSVPN
jgi:hypothetical protein